MPGHDIITVGASAGGVEALMTLVRDLPPDMPAALFVVLHIPAQSPSILPQILTRRGKLPAVHPVDGEPIKHGCIYVAPPDHHLVVERDRVHVVRGPRENRHRPAVDVLMRSAACAYGARVVGVVLTGSLDDGTAGLLAIKQSGGVAVVQDPDEALYAGMPRNAIENVSVDYILPLSEIPSKLVHLCHEWAVEDAPAVSKEMDMEVRIAQMDPEFLQMNERPGVPSSFSCPECKGVLWEIRDGDLVRYRCQTGHAYSPQTMLADQSEALESALYMALNTLEESAHLSRRLLKNAQERNQPLLAARFEEKVRQAEERAAVIRKVLLKDEPMATLGMENGNHSQDAAD